MERFIHTGCLFNERFRIHSGGNRQQEDVQKESIPRSRNTIAMVQVRTMNELYERRTEIKFQSAGKVKITVH